MATSTEIKQRANTLADKTDVNSITPKEVGGIMYDLASHGENVLRNGGTLGIRKVYESVAAMEADSTNPKDFWDDPIKKGNLVVIYDGTTTGVDNNKIYAFMKPGWELATKLDAAYATKAETDAKLAELGSQMVKNRFVISNNEDLSSGILELYLEGLDDSENYCIKDFMHLENGYRLYISKQSDSSVVAMINDNGVDCKIQKLQTWDNSGVKGYVIAKVPNHTKQIANNDLLIIEAVSSLDCSPRINEYISSIKENNELLRLELNKVSVNSYNLVDTEKLTIGYGFSVKAQVLSENEGLCVSDYIRTSDNKNISSNGWVTTIWGYGVYDKDLNLIRVDGATGSNDSKYIYQDGDAFVRITFEITNEKKMAFYGDSLKDYTPYNPIEHYLEHTTKDIAELRNKSYELGSQMVKNRFVISNNEDLSNGILELYLEGLEDSENYCIKEFKQTMTGYRLYISKKVDDSVVALINDSGADCVIQEFETWNNSGIKGYVIAKSPSHTNQTANNDLLITESVSSLVCSPMISEYLSSLKKDNELLKLGQEKVEINSYNLVDVDNLTIGYGFRVANKKIEEEAGLCISGYIKVRDSKNISSNGWITSFWGYGVYDRDLNLIRVDGLNESNGGKYIYQNGDAYIRITFEISQKDKMAFYGDYLKDYTPYNPIGMYQKELELANTVNPYKFDLERGSIHYQTGDEFDSETTSRTGFIPISSKPSAISINIPNGQVSSYVARYYDASKQFLNTYKDGAAFVRIVFEPQVIDNAVSIEIDGITYTQGKFYKNITVNDLDVESLNKNDYDIAIGKLNAVGSYSSELDASPIIEGPNGLFVGYSSGERVVHDCINERVVAINHDDFATSDLSDNRKIYNKYRMNANFNFILKPFSSAKSMNNAIKEVKRLKKDGNGVGLHSILGKSYWWLNKAWDIRPDGTSTFAPKVNDLQGNNADKTGNNVFGSNITASTKASDIGYNTIPSSIENALIVSLTDEQLNEINRCYTIYGDYAYIIEGLDLNGDMVNKTVLGWLEYWYNNLIDDTLGYSFEGESVSQKFLSDYDDMSKYPDAEHLANGKMVHYQDVDNPNYNNSSYQKVGKFTKGLFKGCFSACNWEVVDRCIEVAKAFCMHYYDFNDFNNFGRHGVGFFSKYWSDDNGYHYENSEKTMLLGEGGLFYHSRLGRMMSEYDILEDAGIKMTNHTHPLSIEYYGQKGLYKGQSEIQGGKFNHSEFIDYLNFFGNNPSEEMNYSDFADFLNGVNDWIKFAYENAGKTITRNGKTYKVFNHLKNAFKLIVSTLGTGKIPMLSVDTIKLNPSISTSVDLLLRFCYRMNVSVVPVEVARQIANNNDTRQDYFPNPMFSQSLLKMLGGESTEKDAYVPDGWTDKYIGSNTNIYVSNESLDGRFQRVLTLSNAKIISYIYGLSGGKYKLKMLAKGDGTESFQISIYRYDSKTRIGNIGNVLTKITPKAEWSIVEYEFDVDMPYHNDITKDNQLSQLCRGYENNMVCLGIELSSLNGSELKITNPSLRRI